ncbi:glucosamine-6-phosphate deaminase [Yimella sp. RIT 621]|uniref:glucosamine-6-phosphate deaminase n=1 Tax=Yimella sp. RIT 621 TaxID=2510323 RepID=UPI00101CE580|nr:glucosamine-6-phosphate deaminase [Yimella sp. RIT 621]RYG76498.1 glucosamine-6-phosphate deaminase [Yimella sp. RIT 621]
MEVVICPDAEAVGALAASKVARVCRDVGPEVVIGVATGSSPLALYDHLARLVREGSLDLSRATAFALDEYVGLPVEHPESYASVIDRTVTQPLGLDPARVHLPDGNASDVPTACRAYEQAIAAVGGVDVQILGVGANGHIGFNEPGSSLSSRTRIKTLATSTRADNARFFERLDQVPTHCITQGLGTIMDAREVVLVAQGQHKVDAVAGVVEGPVTARCPGSVLQFHQHATVVLDEHASAGLAGAQEYRNAWDHKPDWQRWR